MQISFFRALPGPLAALALMTSTAAADTVLVERCGLADQPGKTVLILTRGDRTEIVPLGRKGTGRRAMVDRRAALAFLRSRMGPRAKEVTYADCATPVPALLALIDPRAGVLR